MALRIFLTIPVSVASGERSFSKLKLIKNELRSAMGQDRLNNLAILAINNLTAKNLNYEHIIKKYAYKQVTRSPAFF